jgi:hypothetical protein
VRSDLLRRHPGLAKSSDVKSGRNGIVCSSALVKVMSVWIVGRTNPAEVADDGNFAFSSSSTNPPKADTVGVGGITFWTMRWDDSRIDNCGGMLAWCLGYAVILYCAQQGAGLLTWVVLTTSNPGEETEEGDNATGVPLELDTDEVEVGI